MRFIAAVANWKGLIFAALALWALAADILGGRVFAEGSMLNPRGLGEHLALDLGLSLEPLQAGVQRYVAPWLWDDVLVPILLTPSIYLFGGLAVLFFVISTGARSATD